MPTDDDRVADEMPSIPKDSPFAVTSLGGAKPESANTTAASTTVAASSAASASSFSFEFSLGAGTGASGKSVATFDLAAPIVQSADVAAVPAIASTKDASGGSRKIGRPRRNKLRTASEEEMGGAGGEGDEYDEGDEYEEGDENGAPNAPHLAAAPAAPQLTFDSSKFNMSGFAALSIAPPAAGPSAIASSATADGAAPNVEK